MSTHVRSTWIKACQIPTWVFKITTHLALPNNIGLLKIDNVNCWHFVFINQWALFAVLITIQFVFVLKYKIAHTRKRNIGVIDVIDGIRCSCLMCCGSLISITFVILLNTTRLHHSWFSKIQYTTRVQASSSGPNKCSGIRKPWFSWSNAYK